MKVLWRKKVRDLPKGRENSLHSFSGGHGEGQRVQEKLGVALTRRQTASYRSPLCPNSCMLHDTGLPNLDRAVWVPLVPGGNETESAD